MPTSGNTPPAAAGRKSAYVARNRASLIKAAQTVLAEIGPEASIEEFAEAAQISVSTIYKHFENKDALIEVAFVEAFRDWEAWASEALGKIKDPLEELVVPMRLFLRVKRTHPLYAAMSMRNFPNMGQYFAATGEGLEIHVKELRAAKILKCDNIPVRVRSISAALVAALGDQLFNPKAKESDGDIAIEVILDLLSISPAMAKKLAHSPLAV
jgi:AcrR family transcriptional regulator